MGLFGSLFTGVSALFAQSQDTAIISNNIANVNTVGFKSSTATFQSLVTTQGLSSAYSPGTVKTTRIQNVDQQGATTQTASATDASISGNGFFTVKSGTGNAADNSFLFTRAGDFAENAAGILTNSAGFVLYAWPLDANGNLPANEGDPSSLVPANVAFLGGLTRPTTTASLALNLDATQTENNTGSIDAGTQFGTTGSTGLPVPQSVASDFSRGLTVFDSLGTGQTVTVKFDKVTGPEASAQSESTTVLTRDTVLTSMPGVAAGNTFTVTVGANPAQTYIIGAAPGAGQIRVNTVGDVMDQLNETYGGGTALNVTLTDNGQLQIKTKNLADSITLTDNTGTALFGANSFNFPQSAPGTTQVYQPFTLNGGAAQSTTNPYGTTTLSNNQADFPTLQNTANPNSDGWWQMTVTKPDGQTITEGLINFDTNGNLNATPDSTGNIKVSLDNVDWGNGSTPQNLNLDISKFSQFAGNYDVISSDQNGASLGLRTGVEITADGTVVAQFSNGATADLYKIPLVTFANPNGLTEQSGTAYSQSDELGPENLREAGTGGAGTFDPSSVEASNVDLANEFAGLIVAQRAFGAGARVITTVDDMTQDLLNIGR